MIKHCPKCKTDKPIDAFYPTKAGTTAYCRPCHLVYMKERRDSRKASVGDATASYTRRKALQQRNKAIVWDYLQNHPCTDCGESDPIVLQFDHVRGVKLKDISILVTGGYSLEVLTDEIAKCEVRCANCHIKVTMQRARWSKRPHFYTHNPR